MIFMQVENGICLITVKTILKKRWETEMGE